MNLPLDIATDADVFDNVFSVSIVHPTAGSAPVEVDGVLAGATSTGALETPAGTSGVNTTTRVFSLSVASLQGFMPRAGDLLIDSSTTWIVASLALTTLGTRWRMVCVQQKG